MNRQDAIAKAKNLRKHTTVAILNPADPDNGIESPYWVREEFNSISAAKRRMRTLGIGVALVGKEQLPA